MTTTTLHQSCNAKPGMKNPRSKDVPVTTKMLFEVRDQLIDRMDAGFEKRDSQFHELKSEIHGVKSEVNGLKSEVHRLAILIEEQNARNIIVLDGLSSLFHRQERIESKLAES